MTDNSKGKTIEIIRIIGIYHIDKKRFEIVKVLHFGKEQERILENLSGTTPAIKCLQFIL